MELDAHIRHSIFKDCDNLDADIAVKRQNKIAGDAYYAFVEYAKDNNVDSLMFERGMTQMISEWLMTRPSSVNIFYTKKNIVESAIKGGVLQKDSPSFNDDAKRLCHEYFNKSAFIVHQIFNRYCEKNVTIDDLVTQTMDAYSFGRYGHENWIESIKNMQAMGITPTAIKFVLNSKHMRWNADSSESPDRFAVSLRTYINNNRNGIRNDISMFEPFYSEPASATKTLFVDELIERLKDSIEDVEPDGLSQIANAFIPGLSDVEYTDVELYKCKVNGVRHQFSDEELTSQALYAIDGLSPDELIRLTSMVYAISDMKYDDNSNQFYYTPTAIEDAPLEMG